MGASDDIRGDAGGYVVVHPGASVPARAWAPERNAELVQALVAAGRRVVVTGAPGEASLTGLVAGPPSDRVTDIGGRTSLAELADVLAAARCVVVGNTGPAHLAAAVGTPSSRRSPRPCRPCAGGRGACRTSCCTPTCR